MAYGAHMESISRYHLRCHEDGSWHVIDAGTGGPTEVEYEGRFYTLWKLSKEEAEQWSVLLNARDRSKGGTAEGT